MKRAVLALADGTLFEGDGFGAEGETIGEVVFNTSMFGYQEILTDPSYVAQIVTMAYPHMGNVGTNPDDQESQHPHAVGMVVREFSEPSNWRAKESLNDYLARWKIVGVEGLDTRRLVRHLRNHGSQMGIVSTTGESTEALIAKARTAPSMEGRDLATGISVKKTFEWSQSTPDVLHEGGVTRQPAKHHVVSVDYGLKKAMLQYLRSEERRVGKECW